MSADILCGYCGEGILRPVGTGILGECDQCHRSDNLKRLEERAEEAERRRFEGEIRQLLREDEQKGCSGGSSDAKGSRKKLKRRPAIDPGPVHPWAVDGPGSSKAAKSKRIKLSVRPSALLLDLCTRFNLSRSNLADAMRAAIDDLVASTS